MNYKILLLFLFLIGNLSVNAQDVSTEEIAEAEAKAAAPRVNYTNNQSNTGNYDLKYQRLNLNVDPSQSSISGTITSHFVAEENIDQITFDLNSNMSVSAVEKDNSALTFNHQGSELVILLNQTISQGSLDSLSITYSGDPASSGFGSFEQTTHNGNGVIWTLSEPYGAKAWWPCKQDLNDKVDSIDVYLNYPEMNSNNQENFGVSNGLQVSETASNGTKTTHYHHGFPIPAYLVAFAVTNYITYSHTVPNEGNPFEIVNHVYPENLVYAQNNTPVTVDIMEFFSDKFGEYPYSSEQYGHAQFGWGGGMEHTTISFMGNFGRQLIAHELGHHWFGDKVTCGSWQDIWLNEGFATYMAAMIYEEIDGAASFQIWRESTVEGITSVDGGSVYVPAQDTTSVGRIFSGRLSYSKGAMVLHMLRKKLGDEDFFQGLRNFLTDPEFSFSYAKTPDLREALEAQSGEGLNEFFQDWIYGEGYPSFDVTASPAGNGTVSVMVQQDQSHPSVGFFEVGLPIELTGNPGEVFNTVLEVTSNGQSFTLNPGFSAVDVKVDPKTQLISRNNSATLGIRNITFKNFKVYPNPVDEKLFVKQDHSSFDQVKMYSISGKLVGQGEFTNNIDVSKFSAGVYFLEFSGSNTEKVIRKVVVE
jgi:aminopeptidase N